VKYLRYSISALASSLPFPKNGKRRIIDYSVRYRECSEVVVVVVVVVMLLDANIPREGNI
jgi:hypothetical protein